ncbi:hypothetical protein SELMODRAFT_408677 [Selaginella moellendorffii]|uniref:Uncharacterized protein n=1 Tax=Selaginella moellendorffii TaxID=88036 RepID=D8R9L1_SELML|nr:hypothetical protein SELMODRAFT_408677 [Selaginella moellendorffii]
MRHDKDVQAYGACSSAPVFDFLLSNGVAPTSQLCTTRDTIESLLLLEVPSQTSPQLRRWNLKQRVAAARQDLPPVGGPDLHLQLLSLPLHLVDEDPDVLRIHKAALDAAHGRSQRVTLAEENGKCGPATNAGHVSSAKRIASGSINGTSSTGKGMSLLRMRPLQELSLDWMMRTTEFWNKECLCTALVATSTEPGSRHEICLSGLGVDKSLNFSATSAQERSCLWDEKLALLLAIASRLEEPDKREKKKSAAKKEN